MIKSVTSVTVIGPGALGSALIDLISQRPDTFRLHSVWGRTKSDSYFISEKNKISAELSFPEKESDLGELLFITVPDDQISLIADRLSKLSLDWENHSVVHFSGSHSSSLMYSISAKGAPTASMHPLQTFTKGDTASRFKDIWFTIEGDEQLYPALKRFIEAAGAKSKQMNQDQKKAMHLAAVFASNYMVSIISAVEKITHSNGIENGIEMMYPLIYQTFDNIINKGVEDSLSGPISRGDQTTISNHLDLLHYNRDLQNLYKNLGIQALQLANKSARISKEESDVIREILSDDE